jgi:UDP-N-acetyl-D-mannosaminuronic acid dehydrogenase
LLLRKYDLSNKTVGILGMTFKGNVDDFRDSLSFKLKKILEDHAKEVICSDEILQKPYFVDFDTVLSKSDIIIIASPHKSYKNLKTNKILIDIWRVSQSDSII